MYRRSFLKFVAASPLLATPSLGQLFSQDDFVIAKPEDALNVMEFEAAAHKVLPPAHWGYLSTGVDDDLTIKANRDGFARYQLRARRVIDVSRVDTSLNLFGMPLEAPIIISPVGLQKTFNPEGELVTARAARSRNTLQILSGASSMNVDEVTKARGAPVWYQLYARPRWEDNLTLVKRAEAAGCPALAWTTDIIPGRNLETENRSRRYDTRNCASCHGPNFNGRQNTGTPAPFGWDFVRRLKDSTSMKILLKGIETGEDAALGVDNGADGIIVSNHGGRATETGRSTIECLPEIIKAVNGRVPVLIDGGFRRGTDIFKALAVGARAICIGRPYIWGLAAFGQPGVERVIDILKAELQLVMRQCGARSLQEITLSSIVQK